MRAAAIRLMLRVLANSSRNDFEAFALPSVRGRLAATPARMKASAAAISHSAPRKPMVSSNRPPTKKPTPFIAFFEPVNQATHLNNCPEPPSDVALIADFEAVLVMSLATPAMPCAATTQATDTAALQVRIKRRQHNKAGDLQGQAGHQHARNAEARGEPAAAEIGEDAGGLVQQEQERQRERRVAEAVEVQQHQHADRAVGQREAPIARGDDRVVAHGGHQRLLSMTMLARSTMRQA